MPPPKDLQNIPDEPSSSSAAPSGEQTFISHLIELRSRLLRAIACVGAVLLCMLPFQNPIYSWLAAPLLAKMPGGGTMIATEVASSFYAPFVLTAFAAFFVSIPFVFYQAWAFVAPGLYTHEKRLVAPLIISSSALFILGVAFCYYFVFGTVFKFINEFAPKSISVAPDIENYLDFVLTMCLAFGLTFEVPVVVIVLVRMGLVTVEKLKSIRPYVIVGAFVIAAVVTPPDVMSQLFLAIPLCLLYELGLLLAPFFEKATQAPEKTV